MEKDRGIEMADIHVLTTPKTNGKRVINVVYHIPIVSPKDGVVPTPVSSIPSLLDTGEAAALAAGTLYECSKTFIKDPEQSLVDCREKVKTDWTNIASEYNTEYSFTYEYYNTDIDA